MILKHELAALVNEIITAFPGPEHGPETKELENLIEAFFTTKGWAIKNAPDDAPDVDETFDDVLALLGWSKCHSCEQWLPGVDEYCKLCRSEDHGADDNNGYRGSM